jgi:hypothetical protein
VRVTEGADFGFVGWLGFGGVDAFEQAAVAVEERAVDPARRAISPTLSSAPSVMALSSAVRTRWRRRVESARRIVASTAAVLVVMWFSPGTGRAGFGGCGACRAWSCGGVARGDGLLKLLSLSGFEFIEPAADLVDQTADAADLFLRRHGLGASPLIEVGGGEQAFAGAQQVVEVGV